jgi:hypothetical protein
MGEIPSLIPGKSMLDITLTDVIKEAEMMKHVIGLMVGDITIMKAREAAIVDIMKRKGVMTEEEWVEVCKEQADKFNKPKAK